MEEILHHLGCVKLCKYWDKLHIVWCRISSINSMDSYGIQTSKDILHLQLHLATWWHLKSDRPGQQLSWSQACGPQTSWYMLVWRSNSTFGCFIEKKTTAVLPAEKKTCHLTLVVCCGGRYDSKRRTGFLRNALQKRVAGWYSAKHVFTKLNCRVKLLPLQPVSSCKMLKDVVFSQII